MSVRDRCGCGECVWCRRRISIPFSELPGPPGEPPYVYADIVRLYKTPREILDMIPEDIESVVVIYMEKDRTWQTAYSRQDTSLLCFAEKILHREIMRRIEESTE